MPVNWVLWLPAWCNGDRRLIRRQIRQFREE